jgi:D-alanyl-D-alanine carboxypeptidase/D-alanyl-D-alanine-endopeptidase (penicillin-binding protein 4)
MGRQTVKQPAMRWLALAGVALLLAASLVARPTIAGAAPGKNVRPASRAGARPSLRRGSASPKSRPQDNQLMDSAVRRPPTETMPAGTLMAPEEAPPPDASDPDRPRILRLQEALSSIVHGPVLGRMRVGMRVLEAGTGRTFFRQHGTALMDPASNQKVLATTTALMRLGSDYRFRTELYGPAPDADGVIRGDVVLRGSGDPSLGKTELSELAAALTTRGVVRIEGGVFADPRRIGASETAADERSPLRVSRAYVVIRVRPGANGGPPVVGVRPSMPEIVVKNRAVTKGKQRGRMGVKVTSAGEKLVIEVTGKMAVNHPGMTMSRIPPNQRLFAAAVLHAALEEAGIDVKGPTAVGLGRPAPVGEGGQRPAQELLAVHRSLPLTILIRHINKDSNNEWSERLLEVVGAELYGGPATLDKGLRALREAMDELAVPRTSYISTNGSGLGHTNRVTADAMADLLQKLYSDPRWGPELMQSLSVGGVDGTTRNRFRGSPAAERVRAKTGTLDGKSCLSGYVGDGEEVLVFSIMVEGNKRRFPVAVVRAAQVNAVNAMMRYARGVLDAPTGEEVVAPAEDFEVGDDVLETDDEDSTPATPASPGATDPTKPPPLSVPQPQQKPQSLVPPPLSVPLPGMNASGDKKGLRPAGGKAAGGLRR